MPEADETIITRLSIDAQDLIQGARESRNEIELLKSELKKLAIEGKQSVKDIGAELIKVAEARKKALTEEIAKIEPKDVQNIENRKVSRK